MKIILIHNPFEWKKPRTWLALIIRLITYRKDLEIQFNHCAAMIEIEGELIVSDFQERAKVRTYQEWQLEDTKRIFSIVDRPSCMSEAWIKSQIINSSGRFDGYDYPKLVNHATYIKKGFVLIKENLKRFVCSEWIEFLLTGKQVNWAVPNDFA